MDEHVRVLEYVSDRMKHLVEDLLDISRFERGVITLELEDVVLQDLILRLVGVQLPEAQHKEIALTCELEQTPVHVAADHNRLAQVITNLLSNAINYTPRQGRIVVHLRTSGAHALVEVEDSGIGIAEDHLPHIFQPFYRVVSQVEGSGLGLSITREIVELHGGTIDVISKLGVGSTFCFRLPLLASPTA
jgi:signal transduction histidine kinase